MASIESRRKWRKFARTAIPVGAGVLVLAVIAVLLFTSKFCNNGGERPTDTTPEATITADTQPTDAPEVSSSPTSAPRTQAPAATEFVTPLPVQTTEDRSLILCVLHTESLGGSGAFTAKGSCSVDYVNNTEGAMFAAYFKTQGVGITSASVNGMAVRFSVEGEDITVLPFANELMPGETAKLYFEFEGRANSGGLVIPKPAYDTVFDAVCVVNSDAPLKFSVGTPELQMQEGAYVYRLEAERAEKISVRAE